MSASGLPVPSSDYVPRAIDDGTPESKAYTDKLDELFLEWRTSVIEQAFIRDPIRMPSVILDEFGYMMGANLLAGDSDRTKRQKIFSAMEASKTIGSWTYDLKPKADAVTGTDCSRWADWEHSAADLERGGLASEALNNMAEEGDGTDSDVGPLELGSGVEFEIAGNVYIDTKTSALTAEQVAQLVASVRSSVSPYMKLYFGYASGSGFVVYAGGSI